MIYDRGASFPACKLLFQVYVAVGLVRGRHSSQTNSLRIIRSISIRLMFRSHPQPSFLKPARLAHLARLAALLAMLALQF